MDDLVMGQNDERGIEEGVFSYNVLFFRLLSIKKPCYVLEPIHGRQSQSTIFHSSPSGAW
jgi:hypothetical protein